MRRYWKPPFEEKYDECLACYCQPPHCELMCDINTSPHSRSTCWSIHTHPPHTHTHPPHPHLPTVRTERQETEEGKEIKGSEREGGKILDFHHDVPLCCLFFAPNTTAVPIIKPIMKSSCEFLF